MIKRRWIIAPAVQKTELERLYGLTPLIEKELYERRISYGPNRVGDHVVPLIGQILYNRGIRELSQASQFMSGDALPGDASKMLGVPEAVARLRRAIQSGEPIAVYGDFDTDGVTATALLVQTLRSLGARVEEYIPHRVEEGYGLNKEALCSLKNEGKSVIVTVDCGIRSLPEVAYGTGLGLDMIITDHHAPGAELPAVCAIVNPKQPGDPYPFKDLSGVGVAFKLAQALLEAEAQDPLVRPDRGMGPVKPEELLDLVALGTVADLVPLIGENRTLVKRGIRQLMETERRGLKTLLDQAVGRNRKVDAGTIGFYLGPRLNAAGRIEHARTAFQLLMEQYPGTADLLASKLDATNRERQKITEAMVKLAREMMATQPAGQRMLIVASPEFQEGIIGLVASKLSEEAYRPAIAIHVGEQESRGSCRSIPEFNIVKALDECSDLLVRHGGHAAAAGFTVTNENLEPLTRRLNEIVDREFAGNEFLPRLNIDVEAELGDMDWPTLTALELLAPFGFGNREPIFMARNVQVRGARVVGNDHLGLTFTDGNVVWDGIAFRQKEWFTLLGPLPAWVDVAYTLSSRNWGGEPRLQLEVKDLRLSEGPHAR